MSGSMLTLPYPNGWFVVGLSTELAPGKVFSRPFFGQDLVVYRTRSGQAHAVDPHCGHLGAHFGFGGTVEGDLLRCPFHGFCFDSSGQCVQTGYGTRPPPSAQLKTWPIREINHMLLVYHNELGQPPVWELPALDWTDWRPMTHRTYTLRDHPQETTENSVDLGHFAWVHHYKGARETKAPVTDGPYLSTGYAARRDMPLLKGLTIDMEFETHIFGLGYSQVDVSVPKFGLQARLWVLPTPIDQEHITLRLAISVKSQPAQEVQPVLRMLPRALRALVSQKFMLWGFANDAQQDFPIWENKRYVNPPALAQGDGPIGLYRRWAQQFYN